eukprot:NODE_3106_length_816_cov_87.906128_g2584_i0.p2 GENE.NODE_3106_length_816_cov_87.906128_g2584_i0~~NODE_3106_length_816_cov_87.906128_g2584_i0.p2  ORF type:complete len:89 (-),score=21.17 NODE_3106_length_816_cov_87.906128_g2584_i0:246-512(-)
MHDSLYMFNTRTQNWKQLKTDSKVPKVKGHAAELWNGQLVVVGGESGDGPVVSDRRHCFSEEMVVFYFGKSLLNMAAEYICDHEIPYC